MGNDVGHGLLVVPVGRPANERVAGGQTLVRVHDPDRVGSRGSCSAGLQGGTDRFVVLGEVRLESSGRLGLVEGASI